MYDVKIETPGSFQELLSNLEKVGHTAYFLAGGTDLIIKLKKGLGGGQTVHLIDLTGVKELSYIKKENGFIKIGSCTTFGELAKNPIINQFAYCLARSAFEVGSVQIRNRATIGGNIANSSPAADSMPPLAVMGARVVIVDSKGNRQVVPVEEVPCGVGKNILKPGQFIAEIFFPIRENYISEFVKLGSRKKVTISRLNIAFCGKYDCQAGIMQDVNIALGALGAGVVIANKSSAVLEGNYITEQLIQEFAESLAREVENAIQGRYSLPYKREAVKGLGRILLQRLSTISNNEGGVRWVKA